MKEDIIKLLNSPQLLEALAALEHDRWSSWESYRGQCTARGDRRKPEDVETNEERWRRLAQTPYEGLTEAERESDRVEARKTVSLLIERLS